MHIDSVQHLDEKRLMKAIWGKVYQLFGEVGASQTALSKIDYNEEQAILVIRCSHKRLESTIAATAAITEVDDEASIALRVVAVSGTLKALRNKLSKRQC